MPVDYSFVVALSNRLVAADKSGVFELLVDVRSRNETQAGTLIIPGARWIELSQVQQFLHIERLRQEALSTEERKRLAGSLIVFYCQSGVRSQQAAEWACTQNLFETVANYNGSWKDYMEKSKGR